MREELFNVGYHPNLAACFGLSKPYLDSFERDGPFMRSR